MDTAPGDTRVARAGRWTVRAFLRVASFLAINVGFVLVLSPFMIGLSLDVALVVQKFISSMGGVAVVIAVGIAFLLSGAWLRRRLLTLRQAESDRTAARIMTDLRTHPDARVPAFYLYLRAFETTGRLRVPLYLRLRKISIGLSQLVTNDVESYVSNAVRRVAPLVALGRPGETIGAGRIVTEDGNWMTDIATLMRRATGILLVPSSRPGTLWEIETLKRDGLLSKVIFIMPPRAKGELDTKERWEAARQAMASHGLEAPDHQDRGLLFELGPDGRVNNVEPMLLNSRRQVRKSIKRILSPDPPKGGLFAAIARAHRRTRRATFWGWGETVRQLSPYAVAVIALFIPERTGAFDPTESWATVLDRSVTAKSLSDHELSESATLSSSNEYRALEASIPEEQFAEWKARLQRRGLLRLDDNDVRAYFLAFGSMLARVNPATCAAIARGSISPDGMDVAFTYIPSDQIDGYLRARTRAALAEAAERPVRPLDEQTVEETSQQFLAQFDPEGAQRYMRINESSDQLSDDDLCWIARAMYGGVGTLEEPYGTAWARMLAAMANPPDSTEAQPPQAVEVTRK
jgi:hypothetical protein